MNYTKVNNLRNLLKRFIKQKGTNESRIARKAGISIPTLNQFLNKKKTTSIDRFFEICKALDLQIKIGNINIFDAESISMVREEPPQYGNPWKNISDTWEAKRKTVEVEITKGLKELARDDILWAIYKPTPEEISKIERYEINRKEEWLLKLRILREGIEI
jgi:transcriptional regulator with XRE-family HTH domain